MPHRLLIACLLLLLTAAMANAVMDTLQFHYSQSIFPQQERETFLSGDRQFWDPNLSWRNKYVDWPNNKSPAFPGATGPLVFLTDGWHLAKFIMLTALELAILLPLMRLFRRPWYWALGALVVVKFVFGGVFELFYAFLLV